MPLNRRRRILDRSDRLGSSFSSTLQVSDSAAGDRGSPEGEFPHTRRVTPTCEVQRAGQLESRWSLNEGLILPILSGVGSPRSPRRTSLVFSTPWEPTFMATAGTNRIVREPASIKRRNGLPLQNPPIMVARDHTSIQTNTSPWNPCDHRTNRRPNAAPRLWRDHPHPQTLVHSPGFCARVPL